MICMVRECPTFVPEGKLACTFHWSLVPRETKLRLWELAEGSVDRTSADWCNAVYYAADAAKKGDLRRGVPVG